VRAASEEGERMETAAPTLEERLRRLTERAAAGGDDPVEGLVEALEEAVDRMERARSAPLSGVPAQGASAVAVDLPVRSPTPERTRPAGAPTRPPVPAGTTAATAREAPSSRARRLKLGGVTLTVMGVVLALFAVFEFWGTGVVEARSQRILLAEYRGEVASGTAFAEAGGPPAGTPVALLEIPALQLEDVVVEGTTAVALKGGPGHLGDTPLPGLAGNSVILGRRTTYGGPFRNLSLLQRGDPITVSIGLGSFTYLVESSKVVPGDSSEVLTTQPGNFLTLVTSSPAYGATGRLVVVARLLGAPAGTPTPPAGTRRPLSVSDRELGLAADSGALGPVLLWGELLLAAGWVAWRLRRRWYRRAAYLLTLPVLVTLAVLFFENVDRLLPGTL
jgi:sortase A